MTARSERAEARVLDTDARPLDPEEMWAAVASRDADYEGRFFFAVVTTGVYCRPGCSARTPNRENVRFFRTSVQAESAEFRACKRCRPNQDRPSAAQRSVDRARAYLEEHLDESVTLERLARVAHMSAYHLQRTFKRHLGLSPRQYVEVRRAERLKAKLREGSTVSRATYEAGYGSSSRAYEQAAQHLGMTPGAYRKGGRGLTIGFSTATTPLGSVLVAATERGLCTVTLGSDAAALEDALRHEYPLATIEPGSPRLREWVERIVTFVEGTTREIEIPLDVPGTPFQRRVWQALRQIPYGSTASYEDIARAIGQPSAARAVARACASNRLAMVVPCHRVVRKDGDLSGYRWGPERKRRLLEMESDSRRDG